MAATVVSARNSSLNADPIAGELAHDKPNDPPIDICGIKLVYTNLEFALKHLNVSQAELELVLSTNRKWTRPASEDIWVMGHNAVRYDLDKMSAAIQNTKEQVEASMPLLPWQCASFRAVAKAMHHNVLRLHALEEEVLFAWMVGRIKVYDKMVSAHSMINSALNRIKDLCCTRMTPDLPLIAAKALMGDLASSWHNLKTLLIQHMEEEEILGLPLVRGFFASKDQAPVEKHFVQQLKPAELAWLLRPLPHDAKVHTLKERFGVSLLTQKLSVRPAIRKDEETLVRMYGELAAGPGGLPTTTDAL